MPTKSKTPPQPDSSNRMRTSYLFFLFFLLACTIQLNAQGDKQDSASIVKLFNQALQDPIKATLFCAEADSIRSKNKLNLVLNNTYLFNLGKYLLLTARLDSALSTAELGLMPYKQDSTNRSSTSFHNLKGSILAYQSNYKGAISEFQTAIKILEIHNDSLQAALIKNNVANIFFNLIDYKSALRYSRESYETLKAANDTTNLPGICGIYAISAIKTEQYKLGEALANECVDLSTKYNSPVGLIVGHYSQAEVHLHQKVPSKAVESLTKSLELSERYRLRHYSMLNKIGLLTAYIELGQHADAIRFGEAALAESKAQGNKTTFHAIHKNLSYAYTGLGADKKAYTHLKEAHELYISTASIENQKNINDILIKYESEKKEKDLIAERLKTSQKNAELNKRNLWILALVIFILALISIYYFYNKLQKQKYIQLQKDQEQKQLLASIEGEENERKRISNELHDGVASSLTAIKIQLEHRLTEQPDEQLNPLLGQLKSLHEETRRISHNLMPLSLSETNLMESIQNYCRENSSEKLKLIFTNNTQKDIEFNQNTSLILYRTIQELIHNAQKHSQSPVCYIQTSLSEGELTISVEDEGVGFDPDTATYSQGLKSIAQRITDIGGEFSIDTKKRQGTLALIRLKS